MLRAHVMLMWVLEAFAVDFSVMMVLHGLACISLLSFATTMASQNVTVFTIYIIYSQFSPLFNIFLM